MKKVINYTHNKTEYKCKQIFILKIKIDTIENGLNHCKQSEGSVNEMDV